MPHAPHTRTPNRRLLTGGVFATRTHSGPPRNPVDWRAIRALFAWTCRALRCRVLMVVENKRFAGVGPQHLGAAQLVHGLRGRHRMCTWIAHRDAAMTPSPPDPDRAPGAGDDENIAIHTLSQTPPGARGPPENRGENSRSTSGSGLCVRTRARSAVKLASISVPLGITRQRSVRRGRFPLVFPLTRTQHIVSIGLACPLMSATAQSIGHPSRTLRPHRQAVSLDVTPARPHGRSPLPSSMRPCTWEARFCFPRADRTVVILSNKRPCVFFIAVIAERHVLHSDSPLKTVVVAGKWALNLRRTRDGGRLTARHSAVRVGAGGRRKLNISGRPRLRGECSTQRAIAAGTLVCSPGHIGVTTRHSSPPGS